MRSFRVKMLKQKRHYENIIKAKNDTIEYLIERNLKERSACPNCMDRIHGKRWGENILL